jgi:CCR4-NOT transcription complex subunit 1
VVKLGEHFPGQFVQSQNSEAVDNAANDLFQKVFQSEAAQVDARIVELIDTMQRYRTSEVKFEQEVYACMLHSLFDEYRFLHKYPNQYLEKIAKVFGAILKNRIMDTAL